MDKGIGKHIETLAEYFDQLYMMDSHTQIYRGVARSEYELIPALGRCKAKDDQSRLIFEHRILEEFRIRAVRHLTHTPKNDFEWLFLAQHYGIPTRLLDWSTSPLVALYFACEKHLDKEGAVFLTDMSLWYSSDENPFAIDEIGGIQPQHNDVRYINQAGVFTVHPRPNEAMGLEGVGVVRIWPKAKEMIKWQLRKMGIHTSFIFPGLESIACDILHEHDGLLQGGVIRHDLGRLQGKLWKEMQSGEAP
jgi:hypothetical protein